MRASARALPLLIATTSALAACGGKSPNVTMDASAITEDEGGTPIEDAAPEVDARPDPDVDTDASMPDASQRDASQPDADTISLTLTGTVTKEVLVGDVVTLYGKGFALGATLVIEGSFVIPTILSPEVLTFVMPPVSLDACRRDVALTLQATDGRVATTTLSVLSRGPTVSSLQEPVRAGDSIGLLGTALSRARVFVGERELVVAATSPSRIDVSIPRDIAIGATLLRVADTCGAVDVRIEVITRVPQLNGVDPPTLAAGGVAYVNVDAASHSDVLAAHVGSVRIAPNAADLQWLNSGGETLAIRMPPNLPTGPVAITLEGSTGMSKPFPVMGVTAPPSTPPSPGRIILAPDKVATETFPIVTTGGSLATELGPTEPYIGQWDYVYSAYALDDHCLTGRLMIYESGSTETDAGTLSFSGTLEGTYSVKDGENRVTVVARRQVSSADGEAPTDLPSERYTGGIVSSDGGVVTAEACSTNYPGSYTRAYLVLRSHSTGRQLVFYHGAIAQCPEQPPSPQCASSSD